MKLKMLTATKLRLMLTVSLLVIESLAVLFIANANRDLKAYADDVSQVRADDNASQNNIQNLQKIQQELLKNKDVIERASDIVADSQSYEYQDQIITDLNDYAAKAGISVTNIDFIAADPSAATTPLTQPSATPAPAGVKSTSVSVTVKNPIIYENLLRFIKSIEQNLTKMQISRVGLAKDTTGGVSSEALTIEVYIR